MDRREAPCRASEKLGIDEAEDDAGDRDVRVHRVARLSEHEDAGAREHEARSPASGAGDLMKVIRNVILGALAWKGYKAYRNSQMRRSSGRGGSF